MENFVQIGAEKDVFTNSLQLMNVNLSILVNSLKSVPVNFCGKIHR